MVPSPIKFPKRPPPAPPSPSPRPHRQKALLLSSTRTSKGLSWDCLPKKGCLLVYLVLHYILTRAWAVGRSENQVGVGSNMMSIIWLPGWIWVDWFAQIWGAITSPYCPSPPGSYGPADSEAATKHMVARISYVASLLKGISLFTSQKSKRGCKILEGICSWDFCWRLP